MKSKIFVIAVSLSLLISSVVVVSGDASFDGDDKVLEWDEEVETRPLYSVVGRGVYTHNLSFDEVGEKMLQLRHDGSTLYEHIVQVTENGEDLNLISTDDEIVRDDPDRSRSQGAEIRVNRFEAPNELKRDEVREVEIELENPTTEIQDISLHIEGELEKEMKIARGGHLNSYEFSFDVEMEQNETPKDMILEFAGQAGNYRRKIINIERPCDVVPEMELGRFDRADHVGEFNESESTNESSREQIHEVIEKYLRREHHVGETPNHDEIDPVKLIFSEADEDWFEDPDTLKGEYTITVRLDGIDMEMEEAQVTLTGEEDDDEEEEIPGFKMTISMFTAIIAAIAYAEKKRI